MICAFALLEEAAIVLSDFDYALPFLLLALGLGFIFAEIFVPSFGVLGILAGISLLGSIYYAFQIGAVWGTVFVGVTLGLSIFSISMAYRVLPYTPFGKKLLILGEDTSTQEWKGSDLKLRELLNQEGVTISALRPAGMAEIHGQRVDVVARGEMIDAGIKIRVKQVDGNRVVVTRVRSES